MREGISKIIKESYKEYGWYVNTSRHIPYLFDGLKPSYRRLIYTALKFPDKFIKTTTIVGETIGKYHPHGSASLVPIVSQLVHWGIFDGQGNHGKYTLDNEYLPHSAERYTEAKLNSKWREILSKFIKYVPTNEGELGYEEPDYLPVPLPLSLIYSSSGIGVGLSVEIPAFTPKSLLEAYLNDDPYKLEFNYGYVLDKDRSELEQLWESGKGRLYVYFNYEWSDERGGTYIHGSTILFKIKYKRLMELKEQGLIRIRDETDKEGGKLFIQRIKNTKKINDDELYHEIEKAIDNSKYYNIITYFNDTTYNISMRDYIDITYNNYKSLIEEYKKDNIQKCLDNIEIYKHFKKVADRIINTDKSYKQIAKELQIKESIVKEISEKRINTLRTIDPNKEIKKNEETIKELKKLNPDKYIQEEISNL
jgi:DNA gyrase/topoisomerase IV subunit A